MSPSQSVHTSTDTEGRGNMWWHVFEAVGTVYHAKHGSGKQLVKLPYLVATKRSAKLLKSKLNVANLAKQTCCDSVLHNVHTVLCCKIPT